MANNWQPLPLYPETSDWKRMGHPEKEPFDSHALRVDDQELYVCLRDPISAIEIRQQVADCKEIAPVRRFVFNFAGHIVDFNFFRASLKLVLVRHLHNETTLGPLLKLGVNPGPFPTYKYRQYVPSLVLRDEEALELVNRLERDCSPLDWFLRTRGHSKNDVSAVAEVLGPVTRAQLCLRPSPRQACQTLRAREDRRWRLVEAWEPAAPEPPRFNFFCSYSESVDVNDGRAMNCQVEWAVFVQAYLLQTWDEVNVALKHYGDNQWFLVTDVSVDSDQAEELKSGLDAELCDLGKADLPTTTAKHTVLLDE